MVKESHQPPHEDDCDVTIPSEPGIQFSNPAGNQHPSVWENPDTAGLSPRYTLGARIGRGGMGEVFEAYDQNLDRTVAIKVLKSDQAESNPNALHRFVHKAEVLSSLDHPSILPIYERGSLPEKGDPFYAMKLVKGKTLDELLCTKHYLRPKTPESLSRILAILIDACRAIGYAHQRGIVHRDVKPENIMIDEQDVVLVIDWGLAKRLKQDDMQLTQANAVLGTPRYMAPEQAGGGNDEVACQTDVFALGLILYEILTGNTPFKLESRKQLFHDLQSAEIVPPRTKNALVDRTLDAICMKALERDPSLRYSTAHELAEDLERYRNHLPTSVTRLTPIERGTLWCKRNRALASVAVALLLVLLAVIAIKSAQIAAAISAEREMAAQTLMRIHETGPALAHLDLKIQNVDELRSGLPDGPELIRLNRERRILEVARNAETNRLRDSVMIYVGRYHGSTTDSFTEVDPELLRNMRELIILNVKSRMESELYYEAHFSAWSALTQFSTMGWSREELDKLLDLQRQIEDRLREIEGANFPPPRWADYISPKIENR